MNYRLAAVMHVAPTAIYRCHPGMIHLFYGMRGLIAYAGAAFALMGADIRQLLASGEVGKGGTG